MKTQCPHCRASFQAPDHFEGKTGRCPKCKQTFVVKGLAERVELRPVNGPGPSASTDYPTYDIKEPTKPCPFCGETILEVARKCKHCGEMLDASPRPTPVVASPTKPTGARKAEDIACAGIGLRMLAAIIDGVPLGLGSWIVAAVGLGAYVQLFGALEANSALVLYVIMVTTVQWLYFALLESSGWQATLGKKAVGIAVMDVAGQRPTFAQASGRFFGKFVSSLILGLGYLQAAFDPKGQALHDRMAGCLVVRQRSLGHAVATGTTSGQGSGRRPSTSSSGFVLASILLLVVIVTAAVLLIRYIPEIEKSVDRSWVSMEEYYNVKVGMSRFDVAGVVGFHGKQASSNIIEGIPGIVEDIETECYIWQNPDGTNMVCVFQNGKLNVKSQAGLR